MPSSFLTLLFAVFIIASLLTKLWLDTRQARHVARHRDTVPAAFAPHVPALSHQRAANYTLDKLRFGLLSTAVSTIVLIGWTLLGGLDALNVVVRDAVLPAWGALPYQLVLLGAFTLIGTLIELPLEAWHTFRLEQKHGFNRMTWGMWLGDQAKQLLLGLLLGGPIAALILWLMGAAGAQWWLWAWGAWVAFSLLLMVIFPIFIAPLFNKFEPLQDQGLIDRVNALMARCGFTAKGFFVMDGSRRSAHANAYFTGLGAAKRVVFYDTLLSKLTHGEVEAVLNSHPAIQRSAVVGQRESDGNEAIWAFYEVRPGAATAPDDLRAALHAHVAEHLAPYKRPSHFIAMDSLPMTQSGKVLKRSLLELQH